MQFRDLLQDKRYLFWTLQFLGWSGWALTFYLGVLVWGQAPEHYALYLPTVATIGMLFTLLLLFRILWNLGNLLPGPALGVARWEHRVARLVQIVVLVTGVVWKPCLIGDKKNIRRHPHH